MLHGPVDFGFFGGSFMFCSLSGTDSPPSEKIKSLNVTAVFKLT